MASNSTGTEDPFELCGVTIEDKYRVTGVVGAGGFGVVYRGVHTGFAEPIAVKCLKVRDGLTEAEREDLLTKLQDEGRVLHRLSKLSSGIVQALDVGAMTTPNGRWVPYLVLEWLEGETLADYLVARRKAERGPLALEEALDLLETAARALETAHRQKVAHRDVKPENLYLVSVAGTRTMKVLDFGIAKVLTSHTAFTAAPAATVKQASAFTPSYGAPEQFNKKRGATGPWTDVFALALIVVELASGERALAGDDATQLYIAAADPASRPTLRYHGVDTSEAVEEVLARALAIDPNDRYQDVGAFWDALRAAAKASTNDTVPSDVSATGEYVSRNEIDLDPDALSAAPASARDDKKTRVEKSAAVRAQGALPVEQPPAKARAEGRRAADDEPPEALRRDHTKPRTVPRSDPPPPREDAPPSSRGSRSASSRWMPIVVLLALAGATALYIQLRNIEEPRVDPVGAGSGAVERPPLPAPGGPRPAPSLADASLDAGTEGDAAVDDGGSDDAGAGGGDASAAYEVPESMAFIAPNEAAGVARGFFLDQREVTTARYRECVSAGECPPASRVVLTPEAAKALGVTGVDETTTPEDLASSWGERCNHKRDRATHPANCVKHGHAADFCRWQGKRLPTSAEWMLAATGHKARRFPWGDSQPECEWACFGLNGSCVGRASEVASCEGGAHGQDKTPEGIFDLAGNLSEWVSDASDADADGQVWRGVLGGSFASEADQLLSQRGAPPSTSFVTIGFRCALTAPDGFKP